MKKTVLRLGALLLPAAAILVPMSQPAQAVTPTTKHFIVNVGGSTAPVGLGYNVIDSGSNVQLVNALPTGTQAMVWLGQKCPAPADATFKAKVDALVGNPKVFGYYLSDEPHVADCPGAAAALASKADYIRARTGGAQKSFTVLSKVPDYAPLAPSKSHVDLVGIDPYPCSVANPTCKIAKIGEKVNAAVAAGIPLSAIVPVFQTFGQANTTSSYYTLPTATQMTSMLAEWKRLVPNPVLDYSYGWGHQSNANPTLIDSPALQSIMKQHNVGAL